MATSSEEFVNVGAIPAAELSSGLATWIEANVLAPLRVAATVGELRKSVLFFPPRSEPWVLTGVRWPMVLPPEVEVQVAPGARVVPKGAMSLLVIEGPLVAPVARIFDLPDDDLSREDAVGHVLLHGVRVRCVHPEWWGAGSGVPATDTAALQNAVRVALSRSTPLPVELLGQYVVERPVELSPSSVVASYLGPARAGEVALGESDGLELRGRAHPTGATIRCSDSFVGAAMLSVDSRASAVTLRMVSLDGGGKAFSCVTFELATPEIGQVARSAHALRHCTFTGAVTSLLTVTRMPPPPQTAPAVGRVTMLEVSASTFRPSPTSVGARLAGPPGSVVEFRGCTFAGEAPAMVHVFGQGVVATNCRFHNALVPQKLRGPARARPWEELHRSGPEGGVDFFVDHAFDEVITPLPDLTAEEILLRIIFLPLVFVDRPRAQVTPLYRAPGWVSAQDCRSSSLQFLATPRRGDAPALRGGRDSVIVGLHHRCDPAPLMLERDQLPPAIQWWIAPTTGCSLTSMGCRFDGLDRNGAPRVQVVGDRADDVQRPALFEYGVCSADRLIRTPTDGTTNNDDVLSAVAPGRVPYR